MPFFAFRLEGLEVIYQRGEINPDQDVVTFSILVNQIERGHEVGVFQGYSGNSSSSLLVWPTIQTGSAIGLRVDEPVDGRNLQPSWVIGPIEVNPLDGVTVAYSGTNVSFTWQDADANEQADLQLKIVNAVTTSLIGLLTGGTGIIGSVVSGALGILGFLSNPIGKLIGYKDTPNCDGVVFADFVQFTGGGLADLPFGPANPADLSIGLNNTEFSFTKYYTDEANHDSSNCGHIAETNVTFTVISVPSISAKSYLKIVFPKTDFTQGIRQCSPKANDISLLSLLCVRP